MFVHFCSQNITCIYGVHIRQTERVYTSLNPWLSWFILENTTVHLYFIINLHLNCKGSWNRSSWKIGTGLSYIAGYLDCWWIGDSRSPGISSYCIFARNIPVSALKGLHYRNFHFEWALQWRHNRRDGVPNHQPHDCLLNRLFMRRSKKTSKLRVTGPCAVTGEFPAQ